MKKIDKKYKYILIALVVVAVILIITAITGLNKEPLKFEDYYNNEKLDFILDEKKQYDKDIEEEIVVYNRKATFIDFEGEASFLRTRADNQFVNNVFKFKLKNSKDRLKLEKEAEEIYEKIEKHFNYKGAIDLGTSVTGPDVNVDPEKMIFQALLDNEYNIHYSFYPNDQIMEFALRNIDGEIYGFIQYNGNLY